MGNCASGVPPTATSFNDRPSYVGRIQKPYTHSQLNAKLSRKYSRIIDNYDSLEQVTNALRESGLESSNLIVGIDFTKSNEWTGKESFNGRSLHAISDDMLNPYEQAISILGRTLSAFDDDNLIPCFGFGDVSTNDRNVFSFYPQQQPCQGFEQVLARYREIAPHLRLSGPTSFAPVIESAIDIVEQSGGQYHVLVIIADGQVTRSSASESGQLSSQERRTIDAIVAASDYALSIVLVGVGDGPWEMMKQFDDNIPQRAFDNFQFVNFTEIMSKSIGSGRKEAAFALAALMEIPSQFKATMELNILNNQTGRRLGRACLPPPKEVLDHDAARSAYAHTASFNQGMNYQPPRFEAGYGSTYGASFPKGEISDDTKVCPVCLLRSKDMAFGCGHQTCGDCGKILSTCPICRQKITTRLHLY